MDIVCVLPNASSITTVQGIILDNRSTDLGGNTMNEKMRRDKEEALREIERLEKYNLLDYGLDWLFYMGLSCIGIVVIYMVVCIFASF